MKFKLVYVGEVKINPKKRSQHLQGRTQHRRLYRNLVRNLPRTAVKPALQVGKK